MKTSPKTVGFISILLCCLFLIWQDFSLLFQTQIATGIDGYYYILQVNTVSEIGSFYFPTNNPFILYFLSILAFFTNDTIIALKIGATILQILLYLGIAVFLRIVVKDLYFPTLGIFLLAFSVFHLYFLNEFLSNLGALVFLIWGAVGVVKTVKTEKNIWYIFTGLMLSMAIFSHRSALGLIVGFSFILLFLYFWRRYGNNKKLNIIFVSIILILFVFPLILAWQPFIVLPEWILLELSKYPQNPFRFHILMENLILLFVSGVTISFLVVKPKVLQKNSAVLILFSIVLWSLLITFNPFLNHQTGITGIVARLDALAYIQIAIAVPLLLSLLYSYSKKITVFVAVFILPFLILRWFVPLPLGLRAEYLQTREKLVRELPLMRSKICEKPFVVAQHGEQFLVSALLEIPSQQKPPIENQFQCVFWLIHQPKSNYRILFEQNITSSDGEFSLVDDSEMKKSFKMMSNEERQDLLSKNSHLKILLDDLTR
jgi:hypothetical protein